MERSIYEYKDYTVYLKTVIQHNKNVRGYQNKMAESLGIHSSYITRTLSGVVHLTPDHAANLADFLNLDEEQTSFLLLLVQMQRAGTKALKNILQKQLDTLRKKHMFTHIDMQDTSEALKNIPNSATTTFYAFWHHFAIHMLLMNPKNQSVSVIANRLNISESTVHQSIKLLHELDVIERKGNHWQVKARNVFWDSRENESIRNFLRQTHSYWRQRFALQVHHPREEDYKQLILLSIGEKDFPRIKEELNKAANKIREIAVNAPDEDVFVIGMDAIRL